METERADVDEAIAKLRGAIGQLNKEGKKRLAEAFETVNGHFGRLFTSLFGGGEARLEMIESEDPMEGGLEIIAKPPGKKPATLSLLSGGEQTLTALSLIFAVFLTNPSPICVLDEVDAPLDDANVDRFCTLMEKMAEETDTRFLVITHHPMTMTHMDRLFGVTMAERGDLPAGERRSADGAELPGSRLTEDQSCSAVRGIPSSMAGLDPAIQGLLAPSLDRQFFPQIAPLRICDGGSTTLLGSLKQAANAGYNPPKPCRRQPRAP